MSSQNQAGHRRQVEGHRSDRDREPRKASRDTREGERGLWLGQQYYSAPDHARHCGQQRAVVSTKNHPHRSCRIQGCRSDRDRELERASRPTRHRSDRDRELRKASRHTREGVRGLRLAQQHHSARDHARHCREQRNLVRRKNHTEDRSDQELQEASRHTREGVVVCTVVLLSRTEPPHTFPSVSAGLLQLLIAV